MENKKYVITIDGIDCSGKTTLWMKSPNLIQIRGILSNIAYGIKYNRDVISMIKEYNKTPLNFVIYLLVPVKAHLIMNFKNRIHDLKNIEEIEKEILDYSNYKDDEKYFYQALGMLKKYYKGEIILIEAEDNNLPSFIKAIDKYEQYSLLELLEKVKFGSSNGFSVKFIFTIKDRFEAMAKELSQFKNIMLYGSIDSLEEVKKCWNKKN